MKAEETKKILHPKFPIIEGTYQMTDNWAVTLDQKYNRRIEDGSLVIWRPGFTIWTKVWNLKADETPEIRLQALKEDISEDAQNIVEISEEVPLLLSYQLKEDSDDDRQPAFYGFAVSASGHVQIAIYFDHPGDLKTAQKIFASLTPIKTKAEKDH